MMNMALLEDIDLRYFNPTLTKCDILRSRPELGGQHARVAAKAEAVAVTRNLKSPSVKREAVCFELFCCSSSPRSGINSGYSDNEAISYLLSREKFRLGMSFLVFANASLSTNKLMTTITHNRHLYAHWQSQLHSK
jgi:hypothetical protein